ncbi:MULTISPECIES: DUF2140 family protein [Aerococcus]|uniref:DUF2140 family protein n=1 Tax=Aerococcus sanguinicola TaxID=119206 RepID=A0A5N1GLN1_9LACT|nr:MULTISPECIES: DUF2140 family protein [Aerococcus]KAA9301885.1 DUF2140 family protein [Aerococcus sanguinicola]MDK6368693.1 DUF2140 family protein [Aerococcus sp. UMB9870]MDK6679241.1 DUF2140 family protein [Aerococcus sp. UMB8608]MDK6685917.1 DUF2140 family protein [Aerococcus sp. UMB8623]MDK6939316.1 DUF2140 family protein [Aerococcus sp. UMB8487]
MKKEANIWRRAFFILLGLILVLGLGAWLVLSSIRPSYQPVDQGQEVRSEEVIQAEAQVSPEAFNALMQALLAGDQAPYRLHLDDKVHLLGHFQVLGQELAYEIRGQAQALDDGNIGLTVEAIEVQGLDLPIGTSLALFSRLVPDHVPLSVDRSQEALIVRLDKVSADSQLAIAAQSIDLPNNEIKLAFSMPLPYALEQIEAYRQGQ